MSRLIPAELLGKILDKVVLSKFEDMIKINSRNELTYVSLILGNLDITYLNIYEFMSRAKKWLVDQVDVMNVSTTIASCGLDEQCLSYFCVVTFSSGEKITVYASTEYDAVIGACLQVDHRFYVIDMEKSNLLEESKETTVTLIEKIECSFDEAVCPVKIGSTVYAGVDYEHRIDCKITSIRRQMVHQGEMRWFIDIVALEN